MHRKQSFSPKLFCSKQKEPIESWEDEKDESIFTGVNWMERWNRVKPGCIVMRDILKFVVSIQILGMSIGPFTSIGPATKHYNLSSENYVHADLISYDGKTSKWGK